MRILNSGGEKKLDLKEQIKEICKEKNTSITQMLRQANIQSGDFYLAVNGKKPFFPGWKKRIADALGVEENVIFPNM